MASLSRNAFVRAVVKSRLLSEDQLTEMRRLAEEHNDARTLAGALVRAGLLTRWQAGQLLVGRAVFLGKYKLIDVLGRTRSESLFLAEHTAMNRRVALKILSKQVASDPAQLEQFVAEARAAAALDHPNLIRALNIDNEGGRYYVVIEYVEGRDLEETVRSDGPLDFELAANVIRQAADGLSYAHQHGMVHGAIQPNCLLITNSGVVKVLGLGTGALPRGDQTRHDAAAGSPADNTYYGAPETHSAGTTADPRADIYSLGCTLFFAITGKPPFEGSTAEERREKHREGALPDIVSLRPEAPAELVEICRQMMATDPAQRIQSAEEVSRRLAEWQPPARHLKRAVALDEEATAQQAAGKTPGEDDAATGDRRTAVGARLLAIWSGLGRGQRIAVGASAAAVLLVLIAAGAWLMFRGSGRERPNAAESKQVAVADTQPKTAKPPRDDSSEEDLGGFRAIPPGDPDFDPTKFGNVPPATQAAGKGQGEQPSAGRKEPATGTANTGNAQSSGNASPQSTPGKTTGSETAAESGNKQPGKEPAEKPPSSAGPGKEEPSQGQPSEEPASETTTEKETPAEGSGSTSQESKPSKPQGKKPSKPADPFTKLAAQVELPECGTAAEDDSGKAFRLGEIASAADADWQLILLGGDVAYRKNRAFVLEQTEFDAASARWTVWLETRLAGKEPERARVGEFFRKGKNLLFQWADDAEPNSANYFRNCLLQVRVAGKNRLVKLRKPVQTEPIALDLKRGVGNRSVPVKWLPAAEFLRVEITALEPKEEFQTKPQLPAALEGPIELQITRKDRHGNTYPGVVFRLVFVPRSTTLSVRAQLIQPPITAMRTLAASFVMLRAQLEPVRSSLERKLNPPKRDQAPRGAERSQLLQQLDQIDEKLWYVDFWEKFREGGRVRFRLFIEAGDQQLVFVAG